MPEPLVLESERAFDADFQMDSRAYLETMQLLLRRLAVRAAPEVKEKINVFKLRIVNRGRTEAFTLGDTVVVDIALLDLLSLFSFEQAVSLTRRDSFHMLEFNVAYSVALGTSKQIEQLDPYNFSSLSEPQFRQLWNDTLNVRTVAFNNTLAFILAHELGHIVKGHEASIQRKFPDEISRNSDNHAYAQRRREIELEADEFSTRLCLEALLQPGQMLPWFTMTGTRRDYYGTSPEYPTPGQREAVIQKVYADRVKANAPDGFQLPEVAPLAPDRDLTKIDKVQGLKNIREVRSFVRTFFAAIDAQLAEYLTGGTPVNEAAQLTIDSVLLRKMLIQGTKHPELADRAIALLAKADEINNSSLGELRDAIASAVAPSGLREALFELLDRDPPDWATLRELLTFMRAAQRPELALGLDIGYYLTNTRFRWEPKVFNALIAALPDEMRESLRLAPYALGKPAHRPPPSMEEVIQFLGRWDGNYHP